MSSHLNFGLTSQRHLFLRSSGGGTSCGSSDGRGGKGGRIINTRGPDQTALVTGHLGLLLVCLTNALPVCQWQFQTPKFKRAGRERGYIVNQIDKTQREFGAIPKFGMGLECVVIEKKNSSEGYLCLADIFSAGCLRTLMFTPFAGSN